MKNNGCSEVAALLKRSHTCYSQSVHVIDKIDKDEDPDGDGPLRALPSPPIGSRRVQVVLGVGRRLFD